MTSQELETELNVQIERFGLEDTEHNTAGLVAYADDDLPRGVIRFAGDGATTYANGETSLAALLAITNPKKYRAPSSREGPEFDAAQLAYEGAQAEFYGCMDQIDEPRDSHSWPKGLFRCEQLEEGTVNDDPDTLVAIETNAGTRYFVGPHGVSCDAIATGFECDDWHASIEEAKEAYLQLGMQAIEEAE